MLVARPSPGLLTRALESEAAQRAFELGYAWADALEVLTGNREEPHRRARNNGGGSLSGQEQCDLPDRVAGAARVGRAVLGRNFGLSLFDEVDGGPVGVERDHAAACLELDLFQHRRELIPLRFWKLGQDRNCCEPARIHRRGSFHARPPTRKRTSQWQLKWYSDDVRRQARGSGPGLIASSL